MEINWADRYLPILDALVLHTNCVMRTQHIRLDRGDGIMLSQHEWQAFSYLVQHEAENINMVTLSTELAIPKSSLTKISKMLCAHDMVKKYQLEENKKEIFLKPTEKGRNMYITYSWKCSREFFKPLFDGLESISDEDLLVFANTIKSFSQSMSGSQERKLVLYEKED